MSNNAIVLCRLSDLPEQGARGFDPFQQGRDSVFVVRKANAIFAYRDICPHYGQTSLPWKKDEYLASSGDTIVCAAHGAHFEIDTGYCISGPCKGDKLIPVALHINDSGEVEAQLDN